jgi:hypothetical protein
MVVPFISHEDLICSCRQRVVPGEAHLTRDVTTFLTHKGQVFPVHAMKAYGEVRV